MCTVDSVAALARAQFGRGQLTQRQELLGQIASALKQLSERLGMAAFVTNQVTTRWGGKRAGHEGMKEDRDASGGNVDADAGSVTAALGTKWAHCVNTRLVLEGAEGADGKANDGEDAGEVTLLLAGCSCGRCMGSLDVFAKSRGPGSPYL